MVNDHMLLPDYVQGEWGTEVWEQAQRMGIERMQYNLGSQLMAYLTGGGPITIRVDLSLTEWPEERGKRFDLIVWKFKE